METTNQTINFIKSLFPTKEFIPLHEPNFSGNEKKYVNETIDSTFVSSVGQFVDKFELDLAEFTGTQKTVSVVNGTAGLQVALKLVGVKPGDEVLTQALTFIATANAIAYNNAHPVFLDVDLETMGLSPKAVAAFLEEFGELRENGCYNKKTNRKISACVPMHTFGFPVHLHELIDVCTKWNIPIVEDAAESLGSYYHNKHTGGFGEVGVFSYNGNKILTSGGGGSIVTNHVELGVKAKHLTTTAKKPHPFEYVHDEIGFNYRMPNLNAALACAQLEQLPVFIENKRKLAHQYQNFFQEIGVKFRTETPNTQANYWLMCVELESKTERDQFLESTNKNGVMTRPIWQLMTDLVMYQSFYTDAQENARFLMDRIVNIPSSVRR
jgi:aminotransferase in exopolysaccharide biosynthesis